MTNNIFNFTRQQLEEFIYDLRINVSENYIKIILKIGGDYGVVVCAVPDHNMDALVGDARRNSNKGIDEFIRDYHTVQTNPVTVDAHCSWH